MSTIPNHVSDSKAAESPLGAFLTVIGGAERAYRMISRGHSLGVDGALFQAGVVLGVGLGFILAPLSGPELRRALFARLIGPPSPLGAPAPRTVDPAAPTRG
jgi:hypothetical protein